MRARWLCRQVLRCWMVLVIVLGLSCHYYSSARKCLTHSWLLQVYSWLTMAGTLALAWPALDYSRVYLEEGSFRLQGFVHEVNMGCVQFHFLAYIVQAIQRLIYERKVRQVYNELSEILGQDLGQEERTRFYYAVLFGKFHNYLHNFNFVAGLLLIVGMRPVGVSDLLANFYFVYISVARASSLFAYVLFLLDLGEAMRLNGEQEQDSYGRLMVQLRRQERLLALGRQVHRIFAWLVPPVLLQQLYNSMVTIYIGYDVVKQRPDDAGLLLWNLKLIFNGISFVVQMSDSLLLQIACQDLLVQGNRLSASPQVLGQDAKAAQRQWELSVFRRAIRETSEENKVLGLFRMDMRCAFALISSSLSYGIIIIQMGYVHSLTQA